MQSKRQDKPTSTMSSREFAKHVSEVANGKWSVGIKSEDGNTEYLMPNARRGHDFIISCVLYSWRIRPGHRAMVGGIESNPCLIVYADGMLLGEFDLTNEGGKRKRHRHAVSAALNAMLKHQRLLRSKDGIFKPGAKCETADTSTDKPKKQRSMLDPYLAELRVLKEKGYSLEQMRELLAELNINYSRQGIDDFLKRRGEVVTEQPEEGAFKLVAKWETANTSTVIRSACLKPMEQWEKPTGNEIKEVMRLAGLTAREAAEELGFGPYGGRTIRRWRSEDSAIPYNAWARLCDLAGFGEIQKKLKAGKNSKRRKPSKSEIE
jgi:hypothetical protein